ncbi:fibronectin type III domain-containing protein [Desulfosporosinus sp. BG]|uniref:fibronectin type III domain-containing protein n=1 Tax=Desulfosporosinus sp. BG TaxID=1633135 RepID=UPI00083AEC4D|nr:fibronectin type III domain-containing protein [Desulfosporosinus sp. BG]ODA40592.1 N-acetylmuramoyl-L-alanine amidase [Desulfosporosinus sp. BG]
MFNIGKKAFIGAVTVGCLFGGGLLSNVTVANAATIQGSSQQITGFQTGINGQGLLNRWLQSGISSQRQFGQQQGRKLRQQQGQQFGQQKLQFDIFSQVASILDVDEQTIMDNLQAGETLAEIAESYDVSEATLLSKLEDLFGDTIDNAVTAGTITETQATEMEDQLTERLTQLVESLFNNSNGLNTSLSAVNDLSASSDGSDEISLDWNSVNDATSYCIYRATSYSGTYTKIDTVTTTSYTDDTDLADDTTYYYKVQAVNSTGTSAYSSIVFATTDESDALSAPDDLTATVKSSSKISLEWDSVSNATSYYIYRSTSYSGTYSKIATTTTSSYTNTSLSADTKYYYKVKAVNSSETSAYSSIVSATTED